MTQSLSSVLGFGKYAGLTIEAVGKFNPRYLTWCTENLHWFALDDEARAVVGKAARQVRDGGTERQNGWAWGFGREVKSAAERELSRRIKIEHAERRKAGQVTCKCFPNAWPSCECKGAGWVQPKEINP